MYGVEERHSGGEGLGITCGGSHVSMSMSGKMRWQNSWQVMVLEPSSSNTAKRRRNELGLRQTWLALALGLGLGLGFRARLAELAEAYVRALHQLDDERLEPL